MISGAVLGGHLVHVIVFGTWGLVVALFVIWPTKARQNEAGGAPQVVSPCPPDLETAGSSWTQAAFLGLVAAATCHFAVMPAHFEQSWIYGTFFLGAASCQVGFGVLLLARPSKRILVAAVAGSLAIVVLWFVSRFIGVSIGPDNGGTESIGVLDTFSTVAEAITALCCLIELASHRIQPAWRWSLWSLQTRLALLATVVGVPVLAAVSNRG